MLWSKADSPEQPVVYLLPKSLSQTSIERTLLQPGGQQLLIDYACLYLPISRIPKEKAKSGKL